MQKKPFALTIINIFLGASWAILVLFALFAFKLYEHHGLFIALSAAVVGAFLGMLLILIFETLLVQFEKNEEIKKQTKLLEEINAKLDKQIPHN